MSSQDLPVAEFAFPGPLREQLVAAIVTGDKTTTTGLIADYENGRVRPRPGLRGGGAVGWPVGCQKSA